MRAYERLLNYVRVHTTSDENSGTHPSAEREFDLARQLVEEMKALGMEDAHVDEHCYVYGTLPATPGCEDQHALGLIAHMDTADDASGENVQPVVWENYNGGDVTLPATGMVMKPSVFPFLTSMKGETLITSDGTTLLGADDKAGIAEILTAVETIQEKGLPHGKLCIAFTPDEEIGEGAELFDIPGFGADFAYTVDGGDAGSIEYENFNAASATVTIHGFSEKPVLASLREELQSRGAPIPPMTLINESDAALLAAGVQNPGQGRYLGGTWGSSIDVGFVAPGSIVLRWPGIPGDLTLFTGGFSQAQCVPFGLVDYSKDRDCYAPGLDLYLKMVSTDYLGEIFRLVMIKAAERKLLSFGCSRDILSLTQLDLETVRQFMADPQAGGTLAHFCREPEDREVALVVAQAVLERAARLVCANLAAVIQFIGGGRDANAPVCLSLQGSAFSAPPLMAIFEAQVQAYLRDTLGLHVTLWQGDNALPVGTAAAALYRT